MKYVLEVKIRSNSAEELRTVESLITDIIKNAEQLCDEMLTYETSGVSIET